MQWAWNTVPTRSWLTEHGWATEDRCACGAVDDLQHRIESGSPWAGWKGPIGSVAELTQLGWKVGAPGKKETTFELECLLDGKPVAIEDFRFEPGRVFGDGSAPGAGWDELEEMGGGSHSVGGGRVCKDRTDPDTWYACGSGGVGACRIMDHCEV